MFGVIYPMKIASFRKPQPSKVMITFMVLDQIQFYDPYTKILLPVTSF